MGVVKHLDIKLSYACNNNCVHCVVADQRERALCRTGRDHRPTAVVVAELVEASRKGFRLVTFTGGEPTIRKDLPVLVRTAVDLGMRVGIQTNGRVLAHAPALDALCGMDVRFVVALHGPDATVHDAVTRAPGSFEQTTAGIRALARRGERVTVKVVISRLNAAHLGPIASLVLGLGPSRINFTFPHGLGNAARNFELVVPRYSDVLPALKEAHSLFTRGGGEIATEAFPLCLLGELASTASELLYASRLSSEVRQLDQGPRDWNLDRKTESKAKAPVCSACPLDALCEGPWKEYLETYGGAELGRGEGISAAMECF